MEKYCMLCGEKVSELCGYFVCNNCKVIVFSNNFLYKEIKEQTERYLEQTQAAILGKIDIFHDIEQKSISGAELTEEEEKIQITLPEFQKIRSECEMLFQNIQLEYGILFQGSEIKKIAKLLYQLLVVSEKLSSFL